MSVGGLQTRQGRTSHRNEPEGWHPNMTENGTRKPREVIVAEDRNK